VSLSDDIRSALLARRDLRAKVRGDVVDFRCLRHEDTKPSAWMKGGTHGCHVCGFSESITSLAEALGVELRANGGPPPSAPQGRGNIVATYDYVDEAGTLLYQVARLDPKSFRQRRRRKGRGPTGLGGLHRHDERDGRGEVA
jgi:hypothetical protein